MTRRGRKIGAYLIVMRIASALTLTKALTTGATATAVATTWTRHATATGARKKSKMSQRRDQKDILLRGIFEYLARAVSSKINMELAL